MTRKKLTAGQRKRKAMADKLHQIKVAQGLAEPNKEEKPLSFNGYMQFFLDCDTLEELLETTVFTGHWATRRFDLMKHPRTYRVNFHMFDIENDKAHESVQMIDAGCIEDLWTVIVEYAQGIITANPDIIFDRKRCNAVIRA